MNRLENIVINVVMVIDWLVMFLEIFRFCVIGVNRLMGKNLMVIR